VSRVPVAGYWLLVAGLLLVPVLAEFLIGVEDYDKKS